MNIIILHLEKNGPVLGAGWFLFGLYLFLNYLLYKKNGRCAVRNNLVDLGYGWTFGMVGGLHLILGMVASYLVLNLFALGSYPISYSLTIEIFISYLLAVFGFNLWGKWFLKRQGMEINHNVGLRWFINDVKETVRKHKQEQAEKNGLK